MPTPFDQICSDLNLSEGVASQDAFERIKQWCFEHISQEKDSRTYAEYMDFARHYHDVFLPNVSKNGALIVTAFNQMNTIQYAAYRGYDRFLQTIADKALVNSANQAGMTPLHLASVNGHLRAVEVLLAQGADPYRLNKNHKLPIQQALFTPLVIGPEFKNKKTAIFKLLQSSAPDTISVTDAQGETLLHAMAAHGYDTLLRDIIRDHSNLIYVHDNFNNYPIHTAILNGQIDIVKLLLPLTGVTELADSNAQVALHYAAECGVPEILQLCYPYYPDKNIRDVDSVTPLMCAAKAGDLPALIGLIQHGADVHLKDRHGYSVLHYAVKSEAVEIVRWLLANTEIAIHAKDVEGNSAFFYAEQKEMNEIIQLLISPGKDDSSHCKR